MDIALMIAAMVVAGWLVAPPRGEQRAWLIAALVLLWGTLVGIGLWRGVLAGYALWLVVLALMAAIAALMVVWSAVNIRRAKDVQDE